MVKSRSGRQRFWCITLGCGDPTDDPEALCAEQHFNADETELYWETIPDGTFTDKKTKVSGAKIAKDRLTVMLAANVDGSQKLTPLVIGKSKNLRCFKNVKHRSARHVCKQRKLMDNKRNLGKLADRYRSPDAKCKEAHSAVMRQL